MSALAQAWHRVPRTRRPVAPAAGRFASWAPKARHNAPRIAPDGGWPPFGHHNAGGYADALCAAGAASGVRAERPAVPRGGVVIVLPGDDGAWLAGAWSVCAGLDGLGSGDGENQHQHDRGDEDPEESAPRGILEADWNGGAGHELPSSRLAFLADGPLDGVNAADGRFGAGHGCGWFLTRLGCS